MARTASQPADGLPSRVVRAARQLPPDRRLAAIAAIGLVLALFLPFYQETMILTGSRRLESTSATLTGWGAFSWVEGALLVVSAAVLTLLFERAEGRAFHVPGGDGGVILAAGGWASVLVVWRIFDKPGAAAHGLSTTSTGVEWGIFVALGMAALLTYAGARIRAAHQPEPPLPGERELQEIARAARADHERAPLGGTRPDWTPAEPASAEPAFPRPAPAEPASVEPVFSTPARAEPASAEPVFSTPARAEPASAEPVPADRAYAVPAQRELVRAARRGQAPTRPFSPSNARARPAPVGPLARLFADGGDSRYQRTGPSAPPIEDYERPAPSAPPIEDFDSQTRRAPKRIPPPVAADRPPEDKREAD